MSLRTLVVTRRVLTQLRRDRRTLLLILLQPIIIMAVFGYAFGGDVTDARVGIANLDRGTLAGRVIEHMDPEVVHVVRYSTGAEAEAALREGDVLASIVFPSNFTRNFESQGTRDPQHVIIEVYEDNTNPQVTGEVLETLLDALDDAIEAETDRPPAFSIEERVVFGSDEADSLEFFVPGIAAFAIFQLGSLLTVVTIVKERTVGTLPRVMASPVRRWEVVVGYTAAFAILSVLQAVSILFVATVIYRVPLAGSFSLALLATTLVGIVALGFGILVSGVAENEFQATQTVFLFAFPMLFLAGVFTPPEAMPPLLRPLMRIIPLTYGVDAVREVISHGRSFDDIALDLGVLAAFAGAFLLAATFSFGRKS